MKSPTKQTAFRLTKAHLAVLDGVRDEYGLQSRTEALRLVLQQRADTQKKKNKR